MTEKQIAKAFYKVWEPIIIRLERAELEDMYFDNGECSGMYHASVQHQEYQDCIGRVACAMHLTPDAVEQAVENQIHASYAAVNMSAPTNLTL